MNPSSRSSGFVLIGGRSRRLGMDKASYQIGGVPAADLVARTLARVCSDGVRLIGRQDAPWSEFACIPDTASGKGPLAGVVTALEAARTEIVAIAATDLWRIRSETIAALLERMVSDVATSHPEEGAIDVVYAQSASGRAQPLCSVWSVTRALPVARSRLEREDVSIFGVLGELRSVSMTVPDTDLLNVNDPADLEAFLRNPP